MLFRNLRRAIVIIHAERLSYCLRLVLHSSTLGCFLLGLRFDVQKAVGLARTQSKSKLRPFLSYWFVKGETRSFHNSLNRWMIPCLVELTFSVRFRNSIPLTQSLLSYQSCQWIPQKLIQSLSFHFLNQFALFFSFNSCLFWLFKTSIKHFLDSIQTLKSIPRARFPDRGRIPQSKDKIKFAFLVTFVLEARSYEPAMAWSFLFFVPIRGCRCG